MRLRKKNIKKRKNNYYLKNESTSKPVLVYRRQKIGSDDSWEDGMEKLILKSIME